MNYRDIIPWSIIYGEQNKRHSEEIQKLQELIDSERQKTQKFTMCILENILQCSPHDFNNDDQTYGVWIQWNTIMYDITSIDIRNAAEYCISKVSSRGQWAREQIMIRCEHLCRILDNIS